MRFSLDTEVLLRMYALNMSVGEELPNFGSDDGSGDLVGLLSRDGQKETIVSILNERVRRYSNGRLSVELVGSDLFEQPLSPPCLHLATIKLDQDQDVHIKDLYAIGPTLDGLVKCQPASPEVVADRAEAKANAEADKELMARAKTAYAGLLRDCEKFIDDRIANLDVNDPGVWQVMRLTDATSGNVSIKLLMAHCLALNIDFSDMLIEVLGKR